MPKWDTFQLTRRPCPLCGEYYPAEFNRQDFLPVSKCKLCQLWYVESLPSEEDLAKLYNGYWNDIRPRNLTRESAAEMIAQAEGVGDDHRIVRLTAILGGLEDKRILDIGCGVGDFLLLARKTGAKVLGQELSPEASRFVKEHLGIETFNEPLEQLSKKVDLVDVIVMNDVLEHVPDPIGFVKSAADILKTNGLMLIHTPNGSQATQKGDMAFEWTGFKVDLEHVQYFSSHSISRLFDSKEWVLEHLESFGFPSYTDQTEQSDAHSSKSIHPLKRLLRRVPGLITFIRVCRSIACELKIVNRSVQVDQSKGSYHLFCILRKL